MIFEEMAGVLGTPFFIYFEDILNDRIGRTLSTVNVIRSVPTFALKANNNVELLRKVFESGFGADVVTPGEFAVSLRAGVDVEKVIWNGNGKTKEQKDYMIGRGLRIVNVDSIEEFEALWKDEKGIDLFLRINPGVDPHTHDHISTGLEEHKFGVYLERAIDFLKENSKHFKGVHVHVGSQITDVEVFRKSYEIAADLSKTFGFEEINVGGGWGIDYGDGKELDLDSYRKVLKETLSEFERVYFEIGRYIIAPAGSLVSRVLYVKEGRGKYFVVLDTGMSHLIRPALYGAHHTIEFTEYSEIEGEYDVVGFLCESGDFLAKNLTGKIPKVGSLAIIKDAGAYGFSMSSNYNSTLRPPEVLVYSDGSWNVIREGEKIEDLFAKFRRGG